MGTHHQTRWNQRVVDGHLAHELTMRAMLDAGVDGIIDGGDLTHRSRPLPRDVEHANRVDDLRARAGVWGLGNSGNHCAGSGSDISAMGTMHRPDLRMHAVYPDPRRGPGDGTGPYPGLYEIHQPADGLAIHAVSHYGLDRSLAMAGIHIDPAPLPGLVNILVCHGTFEADGRLYHCINAEGQERPIPLEWAQRGWDAMLLSHYHSLGAVPGHDHGGRGQVWYTGSSLTRGFSDELGPRGWLHVTVEDVGRVHVEARTIWQRPQYDLPILNAADMTTEDIDSLITDRIGDLDLENEEAARLTGDAGAIVRQRITGTTAAQRAALRALQPRWGRLAGAAASWQIDYPHPNQGGGASDDTRRVQRLITRRITDYGAELEARAPALAVRMGIPEVIAGPVRDKAMAWAREITPVSTSSEVALTD
ncbi:metallophosphoesterase family protein [Streptomyces sp. NPDC054865]